MHLPRTVSSDSQVRSPEDWLAHSSWVRALARRLCRNASSADDLTQELWLRVLSDDLVRGASSERKLLRPRAWLEQVLRNLWREQHRSERARASRETQVRTREGDTDQIPLIERVEQSQRLVAHVMALGEPYRSTLLAHYFDSLSCEEIAKASGVPASTVRTRLERGLARLRERLRADPTHAWSNLVLPMLFSQATARAAIGSASTYSIGILTMAGMKVALAAVACVALGAWWWTHQVELPQDRPEPTSMVAPATPVEESLQPAALAQRVAGHEPVPSQEGSTPELPNLPLGEPSPEEIAAWELETPAHTIEGVVLQGREPLATGGLVYCLPGYALRFPERMDLSASSEGLRIETIDTSGVFRIHALDPGDYTLAIDIGQGLQHETFVQIVSTKTRHRVVIVLGTARVFGCVRGSSGVPTAGVQISVELASSRRGSSGTFRTNRETDATGCYEVRDLPAGTYWFSLVNGAATDPISVTDNMQKFSLQIGEQRRIDFGSTTGSTWVRGRIMASDGTALKGPGTLHLVRAADGAYSEVAIDVNGSFAAQLLPAEYQSAVSFGACGAAAQWQGAVLVVQTAELVQDIIVPCARIVGTAVLAETGTPPTLGSRLQIWVSPAGGGGSACFVEADAGGGFSMSGLRPGKYRVQTHPLKLVGGPIELEITERDIEQSLRLLLRAP